MKIYTKKEIAHLLDVSPRTILNDIQFLNLQGNFDDRGTKLYSENDFNLISQLREHCKDKNNSRDSFLQNSEVEVLDIEPVVSKMTSLRKKENEPLKTYQESILTGLENDPFFDLEMLQIISNRGWLLPTARLAPLLNLSPQYLNTLDKYSYCGFIISKETYVGNRIMWKVTRGK